MNYAQYTVNDFLLDDSFKSWVVHPLPETDAFWQRWLAEHPEKSREVDEAKALILAMDFRQYAQSEPEYQVDWAALNQRMPWKASLLVRKRGKPHGLDRGTGSPTYSATGGALPQPLLPSSWSGRATGCTR